jgi:HlyD family secretion protein
MSREIFRSAALAKLSSPDQLDALLYVTTPRYWAALLGMLVLLAAAVVWGFSGRLSTKAEGKGAAVRAGNLMNVSSLTGGQVTDLYVKVGDLVQAGQLVAMVGQPELREKLRANRIQLDGMREQVSKRVEVRAATSQLEQESLKRQREALLQRGVAVRQHLAEVESQIPAYQALLQKGLIARQSLTALIERKAELENNLSTLQSQLVQLDAERFKSQAVVDETQRDGESQITDQKMGLGLLEGQLSLHTEVRSPYAGQVTEVQTPVGALANAGGPVLTLQPANDDLEIVAFFPAQRAKEIEVGMPAQVVPAMVKVEEFGFLVGEVRSVSEFPSTDANIMRVFQNNALAAAVAGGPVHEVRIALRRDPSTPSGFKWSSRAGAPVTITPATLCSVKVITREQAPVTLIVPGIKALLGAGL